MSGCSRWLTKGLSLSWWSSHLPQGATSSCAALQGLRVFCPAAAATAVGTQQRFLACPVNLARRVALFTTCNSCRQEHKLFVHPIQLLRERKKVSSCQITAGRQHKYAGQLGMGRMRDSSPNEMHWRTSQAAGDERTAQHPMKCRRWGPLRVWLVADMSEWLQHIAWLHCQVHSAQQKMYKCLIGFVMLSNHYSAN